MKKILLIVCVLIVQISQAQVKIFTKNASISFFSKAPIENIEAHNKSGVSVIDKTTGALEFKVILKGFEFEKALMQEHFNENYVESSKFPNASFKGKIQDLTKVSFDKDGNYTVIVKGDLTLHGVTKPVSSTVNFTVSKGIVSAKTDFAILLSDFAISIPSLVKDKISQNIKITVNATYKAM